MGEAAADRAAVADLIMRDMRHRCLEQRVRGLEPFVILDLAPAHHGAECDTLLRNFDSAQVAELAQIDEQRGLGKAERQHRHQALATCDGLGVPAGRGEELNRFGQRRRACIVEGRQFHDPGASFGTQGDRRVPIIAAPDGST